MISGRVVTDDLPIFDVLPELTSALNTRSNAVLVAPPGAGKTTAVAPALLYQSWCTGKIILTSPRRVAARAAAERMALMLGENVGETVGYLTRLDTRRSEKTRILVVTETILVNMILEDAELAQVSALLFDEAHERHLDTDLALALALESQSVLREDLRILVMSATIDGARFGELLGKSTPVVESSGRAHPLRIEWLGSSPHLRTEDAMADAIVTAWKQESGDILAFLPGVGEIERTRERLHDRLPAALILPLHGQVLPAEQRQAIRADPQGRRRIVLATAIAETSLTLDGVSVVVDSGLSRRAEFDRAAGTTKLVTHRASQAASDQRAGRAARQGAGVAYRLWEEASHPGRPAFDPPEIILADLSPLVLSLAAWGTCDIDALNWLDRPQNASIEAARRHLRMLRALDETNRITDEGRRISALPLDPGLAAMLLFGARHGAAPLAAKLALLLQERNLGGKGDDLEARLNRWNVDRGDRAEASRRLASKWADRARALVANEQHSVDDVPAAVLLAAARPDFIAKRRDAGGETWLASGGRGFTLDPASALGRSEYMVIGDAQGQAKGARITSTIAMEITDIERWFDDRIDTSTTFRWNDGRVEARRERRLGSMLLSSGPDPEPDEGKIADFLISKVRDNPIEFIPEELISRASYAQIEELKVQSIMERADLWLRPLLAGRRDLRLDAGKITEAILGFLDWKDRQKLDALAPRVFTSPAGTTHGIDYEGGDSPSVEVRAQAMFGLDTHPMIGDVPLLLKLTSPAGRPIQSTRDLPGFWRGSWSEVRKEMKGRYPKHRWPESPWTEKPSLKTKRAFSEF